MDVGAISQGGQQALSSVSSTAGATNSIATEKSQQVMSKTNTDGSKQENKASVSEKEVKQVVDKLNRLLDGETTHAEYEIHKGFGDVMIKIVDNDTKQIIREIPSKKILDMVEKLCEMAGVMIDKRA